MTLFHVKDDRAKTASLARIPQVKSFPASAFIPVGQTGRPIWTNWSTAEAVRSGFKASTWVFACISKRMKAAASVPLKVQEEVEPEVWEDSDSPEGRELARLLHFPNEKMSSQDMTETIVSHLDLGGNALLTKVRVRNQPAELWIVRPDRMKPVPSRTDYIAYYEYDRDGQKIKIPPQDVVHFRYIDPSNEFWGISPLMAGGKTVDMEVEAVNWNKETMQNRAVPDGMISAKIPMSGKQFEEANAYLENQLLGASNARRPFVMGHDADFKQFSLSPAELDFIESRKLTREEICAMFAVPPPLVGIYDKATLANIQTARVIFWLDSIVPFLENLPDVWTFALAAPDFGPKLRVVYDVSKVQAIQELLKEKIKAAKTLSDMGVPFNDINQRLDLGFADLIGGDVGYLPANVQPTTQSVGSTSATLDFDEEDEEGIEGE